jgi:hypothetical protein
MNFKTAHLLSGGYPIDVCPHCNAYTIKIVDLQGNLMDLICAQEAATTATVTTGEKWT